MELRSGRRLGPWQAGSVAARGRARRSRGGGEEDRLSALPDALLHLILSNLGSTAEVARTSTVSRRWSSLWPDLPVLIFPGVDADTLAALLAKATHPNLTRLEIRVVPTHDNGGLPTPPQISSLLRAAADHAPENLVFAVGSGGRDDDDDDGGGVPFELPCFARAISIDLQIHDRSFILPPPVAGGEFYFSRLEKLRISHCCVDPGELLHRCPRLRVLDMDCRWVENAVSFHSGSLEELVLKDVPPFDSDETPRRVDVVAPMLKVFGLQCFGNAEMVASFSAPAADMLEKLSFRYCSIASCSVGFGKQWRVMDLGMEWQSVNGELNNPVHVRVLSLLIGCNNSYFTDAIRSFEQEIERLAVKNVSILKVEVRSQWHDSGTVVPHLLKTLNAIHKLELVLPQTEERFWTPKNYDPDDQNTISLPYLQEVEIQHFHATDHDVDIMKLLFESAPQLKTIRVQLPAWASQSDHLGYKELCSLFWAHTSVKCYVNGRLLIEG